MQEGRKEGRMDGWMKERKMDEVWTEKLLLLFIYH